MRHRVKTKTLKRDGDHRRALRKNLSTNLTVHESIVTTLTKAKYIRPYFEKLVTRAKRGNDFNNVKYMKTKLTTDEAVRKMLSDLGTRFKSRPGGYTRIVKMGNRDGDKAPMARIELTEKPATKKPEKKKETKPKAAAKKTEAPKKRGRPKKTAKTKKETK